MKNYYFYIASNDLGTVLYAGVTNNLVRRMYEHRNKLVTGFTSKYNINKLVYFEAFNDVHEAIKREKLIKGGSRIRKLNLIRSINPGFEDLYQNILD